MGATGMTQITERRMSGERRGGVRRNANDRRGGASYPDVGEGRARSERRWEVHERRVRGQRRGANERRYTERRRPSQ